MKLPLSYIALFGGLLFFWSQPASGQDPRDSVQSRIRSIEIRINEVFEGDDIGAFYRTVNQLKISTRESVVQQELLFKPGDVYDRFVIEESERNLRSLPFLRRASIVSKIEGDVVDVIVSVQDTWTLFPEIGFSIGGGSKSQKRSVGLSEGNLLGFGKRLEFQYADDEGREKISGVWDDERLFGTKQRLLLAHFERSDGRRSVGLYGRPFRSLVEKNAWQNYVDVSDTVGRLFSGGDERFIFRQRHQEIDANYTFAVGNPEERIDRITVGYEYLKDDFLEADANDFEDIDLDPESVSRDPALLADDRKFSGPYISFTRIHPDFVSSNYIDRFDRVEDFNLGAVTSAKLGFAAEALDSQEDTFFFLFNRAGGWTIDKTSFLRAEIGVSTRFDSDSLENSLIRNDIRYYNVLGPSYIGDTYIGRHTIAGAVQIDYGDDLDRDREFLLGAAQGLRGYEDRTFTGDKRVVLNLEDRFHLLDDVFRLVSLGGAVFLDVGGTTSGHFGRIISHELHGDIGLGLRIAFPRSAGSAVLRVDLAFPLRDGPDGSDRWEPRLVATLGQVFSASLRSERVGVERANVSVGLNR